MTTNETIKHDCQVCGTRKYAIFPAVVVTVCGLGTLVVVLWEVITAMIRQN